MASTFAASVLLRAVMATASLLLLPASAAPAIGLPGCDTTCGGVSVPYPFGFGPSRCYWPGLNLTCDTTTTRSCSSATAPYVSPTSPSRMPPCGSCAPAGFIINATGDFTSEGWNVSFGHAFTRYGYQLSYGHELVVSGCNVMATLVVDNGNKAPRINAGCATFCTMHGEDIQLATHDYSKYCTGIGTGTGLSPCCQAPLVIVDTSSPPREVHAKWLYGGNHTAEQHLVAMNVFVAEEGWVDQNGIPDPYEFHEVPLVLEWSVSSCHDDIRRKLCRSEHSDCLVASFQPGYVCQCDEGYNGNPYLPDGCQDIDECKLPSKEKGCLLGECINTMGSYECRCPVGTYGNPAIKGGCIKISNSITVAGDALSAMLHVGLPNCSTTCGDVSVPYPFGFGPSHCYWPGFNLTCDTSHNPPRLLLGTLQVVDISLPDSTVRVIHHTVTNIYPYEVLSSDDIGEPYMLSTRNELILFGCNVDATLYGEPRNGSNTTDGILSHCISTCTSGNRGASARLPVPTQIHGGYCSGHDGCCHAPIPAGSTPKSVDITHDEEGFALISEKGLTDEWYKILNMMTNNQSMCNMNCMMASPLVLWWAVNKKDFSMPDGYLGYECPGDVASRLCISEHSNCRQENGGFTCYCSRGYHGNPYITDGCQDINECDNATVHNSCFGDCINSPGYFECRCPRGTNGNPWMRAGCVSSRTGLIIGLSVASGPALLLLVLGIIVVLRKIKLNRIKAMKQKYFKQNRGQLLQQLVSQNADIAERMIIPVDELAKATNNFDRARELGGGGHGTVYKGILSDLHVVAIKKSKITVQKEIDEFINEVAILSQVNHKNVVKLFGCCLETEVPLLVYEFISNGTLYDHLHVEGLRSLSWGSRLRIATEIATSIAYLHSAVSVPIIYRDIKSSNILLDDTLTSKVSDFGASRYIAMDQQGFTSTIQGTRGYMDPMCICDGRLTEKSDVYSFGVILIELLTRKKQFSYLSHKGDGLATHFVKLLVEGNMVEIIDPQVIQEGGEEVQDVAGLAASCVKIRDEERPTMRQVEHTLEGLWSTKKNEKDDTEAEDLGNQAREQRIESSRIYSLEQEMVVSASYPR